MRTEYRSASLLLSLAVALGIGASAAQARDNCPECWLGKSSLTQDKSPSTEKQQEHKAPEMHDKVAVAAPAADVSPDNADEGGGLAPAKALGGGDNQGEPPADDLPKAADAVGDGNDDPADNQVAQAVDDKGKGKPKKSHGTDETEGRSDHRGGDGGGKGGGNSGGRSGGGSGGGRNADGSPK
jgi:hypothetical protein